MSALHQHDNSVRGKLAVSIRGDDDRFFQLSLLPALGTLMYLSLYVRA